MITVYTDEKCSKKRIYQVCKVNKGKDKVGNPYTILSICDMSNDKISQTRSLKFYSIYVKKDLNVDVKDKIVFLEMRGFECLEKLYNGKRYVYRTIFGDVEVVSKTQPTELPTIDADNYSPF